MLVFLSLGVGLVAAPAAEDVLAAEVEHLLTYVEESKVEFIRNGKAYSNEDALKHMNAKADHFKKKIKSAEDFVHYAATKSLVSGKPYQVKTPGPDGKVYACADWLLAELARYREQSGGKN